VFSLLIAALVSVAHAQGFHFQVEAGVEIPLAVPAASAPHGDMGGKVAEVRDTVANDLQLTGRFEFIDPLAYIDRGGVKPGSFDMADWTALDATLLVKTEVMPGGAGDCPPSPKMCADAYVYYVLSGEQVLARRFQAAPKYARHLGHKIADAVMMAALGEPGFFGTRIAAVGSQGGNKEIYVLGIDGKDVSPVTNNGSINLSPAWSPDGNAISWTSYKNSNPDVYLKDLRSGRTRILSNRMGINVSPTFSPDGGSVAVARTAGADSDLFLIDSRTGELRQRLTTGGGIDVSPSFAPDGKKVAFASERSGGAQIYLMDLTTGGSERVTYTGDFNTDPVISPTGDKIAFVSRAPGGFDIVVVDIDGRNPVRITQDMADNEDPAWSPDGRYLVFSSTRNGRSELWISTADGRHQRAITRTGGWTQPTWGPQG